jgi:Uncharacterized alpha/beta hydrolase domain (DUF2235)
VDSVGLWPRRLPFASSPTMIRTFRHALSLDERRVKFKATPWNRPTAKDAKYGIKRKPGYSWVKNFAVEDQHANDSQIEFIRSPDETTPTDVEEVWFAVRLPNRHKSKLYLPPSSHCRAVIAVVSSFVML